MDTTVGTRLVPGGTPYIVSVSDGARIIAWRTTHHATVPYLEHPPAWVLAQWGGSLRPVPEFEDGG